MSLPPRRSADLGRGIDRLAAGCKRYGPGRLPKAENHAVGAGYAGASAAICAAIFYAGISTVVGSVGLDATADFVNIAVAALALPFVVPAAFAIGYAGWKIVTPTSPVSGLVCGFLGVFATYGVALLLFGILVTVPEVLSGASPLRAAVFSWGVIYFAFIEAWWAAVPIGTMSGFVYVAVISPTE
ncbi:hypothetical protein C483_07674 [Natrialba hulunbeirensis JCM 10989]|uniref:Uncharacterized protein n=1 Tax=Natrialba hulunbeirensis JCM 10989 TaxID=1227493 RepID=M0A1J5_9EURY|nr:hypothetical protein [Natrialba hulunbeirensis]ELY92484.1 hypothetical protein C483_07674 [Natrialba hulunbeirensis JCM 10989]